jgi:hypothetical protein
MKDRSEIEEAVNNLYSRNLTKWHVERMIPNGRDDFEWEEVESTYDYHEALQECDCYAVARVTHYDGVWHIDFYKEAL